MAPSDSKPGLFARLKARLSKSGGLLAAFAGPVDETQLEELETRLIQGDVGIETSQRLMENLRKRKLPDSAALRIALIDEITTLLAPVAMPFTLPAGVKPFVVLALGVNGVGKTTTLGKLAQRFKSEHKSVMLAAGDTFRAAAVEQLQLWGSAQGVPVIAQGQGADPAAVAHDAYAAAKTRNVDVLLVDTAGRLHTQAGLMDELKKVTRVLGKFGAGIPQERLLVLDAGLGQNALRQIEEFHAAVGVTGLVITKLDGTAKGGIVLAAAARFRIPIRFIGIGESAEDLAPFDPQAFAEALVG
ncbi:MAG TPA: signal recognition particle-docking protein FtsY [Gammaproteobacteria bacterium]|nr:signal recognition particle-docking protein FtsY [Gammaproteobacteria bacterium]